MAASHPFAPRLVGTSTMFPRFVPGSWKNHRLPLKRRPRNMFPLLREKLPLAGEAAAALESPKGAGPSRGRKQDSLLRTDAAPKIKEEKGRKVGKHGNLDHPGHLSLLNQMSVPGNSMSSPCWDEMQIPFPQTGSGVRKASRPLMVNPRGSTQIIRSPRGAFCSLPH